MGVVCILPVLHTPMQRNYATGIAYRRCKGKLIPRSMEKEVFS